MSTDNNSTNDRTGCMLQYDTTTSTTTDDDDDDTTIKLPQQQPVEVNSSISSISSNTLQRDQVNNDDNTGTTTATTGSPTIDAVSFLLDHFPVNERELQHLLCRFQTSTTNTCNTNHHHYHTTTTTKAVSVVVNEVQQSSFELCSIQQRPIPESEAEAVVKPLLLVSLSWLEEQIPEIIAMIDVAMRNVFVTVVVDNRQHMNHTTGSESQQQLIHIHHNDSNSSNKWNDDLTPDSSNSNSSHQNITTATNHNNSQNNDSLLLYHYLEAMVSLCGRRGGHRMIVETIYNLYNNDSTIVLDSNHSEPSRSGSSSSSETTTPIDNTGTTGRSRNNQNRNSLLSSFLYRLCIVYLDICTVTNHDDIVSFTSTSGICDERQLLPTRTTTKSLSIIPKVWDEYFQHLPPFHSDMTMIEWKDWVQTYAPMIPVIYSTVVAYIFLQQLPPPALLKQQPLNDSTICTIVQEMKYLPDWMKVPDSIIPLQLTLMGLGGAWRSIYQSTIHGLSLITLTHQLLSYHGSTILIIETTNHEIFGYYTTIPWKVSTRWYTHNNNDTDHTNNNESFLFRLYPSWNVYRPQIKSLTNGRQSQRYHQYLNPSTTNRSSPYTSRCINSNNTIVGLAVGGVAEHVPRLHITSTFEQCKACCWDNVFDTGPLLSNKNNTNDDEQSSFFDVMNLEVWAVQTKCNYDKNNNINHVQNDDDDAMLYEQGKRIGEYQTSTLENLRLRSAKVDRTQFVDDFINGTIGIVPNDTKLFHHRLQTRGRADFVVASDHVEQDGYIIDGKQPSPRCS